MKVVEAIKILQEKCHPQSELAVWVTDEEGVPRGLKVNDIREGMNQIAGTNCTFIEDDVKVFTVIMARKIAD